MKQDQKHKLVQRSQHSFLSLKNKQTKNKNRIKISLMFTNPASGSRPHKCYDPGTPSSRITVQFRFSNHVSMILPSNVLFPFQIKQEDSTSEKKVPRISSSSSSALIYIYIYPYVFTYTQSQRYTHLC